MAINKDRNVNLQITMPKEDAEHLEALHESFNKEGIKCTKSEILTHALRQYVKMIVQSGMMLMTDNPVKFALSENVQKVKQEAEARKEKKDA